MSRFNYSDTFEPDEKVLNRWLYTKKHEMTSFGITRPGLFNTTDLTSIALGVIGVLILEGGATLYAYNEGVRIEAILASIFADVILAIFSHIPVGTICKSKNLSVFAEGIELKKAKNKESFNISIQRIIYSIIILNAFFKFFWFYSTYGQFNAESLFILICYFVGGLLHITCTGYFIFTVRFELAFKNQYQKYLYSNGIDFSYLSKPRTHRIKLLGIKELKESTVGKHKIIKDGEDYILVTNGILTDEELTQLIGQQQTMPQQHTIAIEGVKHQYNLLG